MKNFSIRFILLILLVVAGPTIQKMVLETQQKDQLSAPISDLEEPNFENESEESDGQFICLFLKYFKSLKLPIQSSFLALIPCCNLAETIVLPPPQF